MNITRRDFLKLAGTLGILFSLGKVCATNEKILVAYFSRTGNTEIVAEIIAQKIGGDLFKICSEKDYPADYDECKIIASREKATKARPKFIGGVNISSYDLIFMGYPIWYGDAPQIVYTFLEYYNFGGKKIVPFCTSGSSGLSGTDQNITLTCPTAKVLQGFSIPGKIAKNDRSKAESIVMDNLKRLELI